MRKCFHQEIFDKFSETPQPSTMRHIESRFSKLTANNLVKVGIFAIKNDKKRSILTVPKQNFCYTSALKENKDPHSCTPEMHSLNHVEPKTFTPKLKNLIMLDAKSSEICKSARRSILNSSRYRKNPNIESLKIALEEISKNPPKPREEEKNCIEAYVDDRSDIEKLVESQQSGPKTFCLKKLKKLQIQTTLAVDKFDDNSSQQSDPSPVREKLPVLKTDRRGESQKLFTRKSKPNPISEELKRIKLLNKMPLQESSKHAPHSFYTEPSELTLNFDYKKESLRILKNTSSFANKIMKSIRLAVRHRDF